MQVGVGKAEDAVVKVVSGVEDAQLGDLEVVVADAVDVYFVVFALGEMVAAGVVVSGVVFVVLLVFVVVVVVNFVADAVDFVEDLVESESDLVGR